MISRRRFISASTLASAAMLTGIKVRAGHPLQSGRSSRPVILSTWDFGLKANHAAWEKLNQGGSSLDAVEAGIRLTEADPDNLSVGIGGLPDREGIVTLDASIMDETGKAGSVTFLRDIMHPISVARLVMEKTPHVMLSGAGALQFALEQGFERTDLLTDKARKAWDEWKIHSHYKPVINLENHDTIGMLVYDEAGRMAGGCSTSGLAYKMHGRVGDSPIIGAGLFVDNEAGAAVATGLGELVMRTMGAFLVVELIRSGMEPFEACRTAIRRIIDKYPEHKDVQVAIISMDRKGNTGAFAIQKGFSYAISRDGRHEIIQAPSYY